MKAPSIGKFIHRPGEPRLFGAASLGFLFKNMAKKPKKTKPSANAARAKLAQSALATFILQTGVDKEDAIADLLNGLQHLSKLDPTYGNFNDEAARAGRNFESDRDDDPFCVLNPEQNGPVIVVDIDGGVVVNVRSSGPARVLILDADTEGGSPESIFEIDGSEYYVHDHELSAGSPNVDPQSMADVISQIKDELT